MTLQDWISQYDFTALGFSVMIFLSVGIEKSSDPRIYTYIPVDIRMIPLLFILHLSI